MSRDSTSRSSWAFDRDQHALKVLESASPEFARAITRALVPDPGPPDVLRRTLHGEHLIQRRLR